MLRLIWNDTMRQSCAEGTAVSQSIFSRGRPQGTGEQYRRLGERCGEGRRRQRSRVFCREEENRGKMRRAVHVGAEVMLLTHIFIDMQRARAVAAVGAVSAVVPFVPCQAYATVAVVVMKLHHAATDNHY